MLFEELVLHNFGVYGDRQVVNLRPGKRGKKPVVLVGGQNGCGKTTLLDAIHLVLYGGRARCSNRGDLGYEEFLRRSIHRDAGTHEGAALELQFRRWEDAEEHVYRVHRSWAGGAKRVKERVEVLRDGKLDSFLSESWAEHVEEILPYDVATLFLFDGEKIEELANLEHSKKVLATAIQALLGLNLVERLETDLLVLERRKKVEVQSDDEKAVVERMRAVLDQKKRVREELVAVRANAQTEFRRKERLLEDIEDRLKREGGDLYEGRAGIEADRKATKERLAAIRDELRQHAAGVAPLLMVSGLIDSVHAQVRRERAATDADSVVELLAERDRGTLAKIKAIAEVDTDALAAIEEFLNTDRSSRSAGAEVDRYLQISESGREQLAVVGVASLAEARTRLRDLLQSASKAKAELNEVDRRLAAVPNEEAISDLIAARERAAVEKTAAEARLSATLVELESVTRDIEQQSAKLVAEIEKNYKADFAREDATRVLEHSKRTRDVLRKFRTAIVSKRVRHIEQLVLESFQHLLRKQSLIEKLHINPKTFDVELVGPGGEILPPDRLSAGERQLLAVSFLWGLARASGQPLPMIIDTPLGRLDSTHRSNLVERYFPHASHQVILLSTDEEIDERYFDRLKRAIGRSYYLEFDESEGHTRVQPGYFWQEVTS